MEKFSLPAVSLPLPISLQAQLTRIHSPLSLTTNLGGRENFGSAPSKPEMKDQSMP